MALSFATPFDCWMGLVSDGVEVHGAGYVRRPAAFLATAENSVVGANVASVQWPPCGPDWGAIDTVNIYDALTGGHIIGTGLTASIVQTQQYDILRVPAGGYQVYNATRPLGFGTLAWGVGKYATWHYLTPPSSGLGSPYDVGPYGAGPVRICRAGGAAAQELRHRRTVRWQSRHLGTRPLRRGGSIMSGSDYTKTTNLGLFKPIANLAVGLWGDLWNSNADALDSAIHSIQTAPASLKNAANDAAAATAGVPVGGMYRNGSVLMVRVA